MSSLHLIKAFEAEVSDAAKIVLLKLADNADNRGFVRFSLIGLASQCLFSQEKIQKYLNELSQRNLVVIKRSKPLRGREPWLGALLLINRFAKNDGGFND